MQSKCIVHLQSSASVPESSFFSKKWGWMVKGVATRSMERPVLHGPSEPHQPNPSPKRVPKQESQIAWNPDLALFRVHSDLCNIPADQ